MVFSSVYPYSVFGLSRGVTAVATGYDHTCALLSTGGVKCWGYPYLGNGTGNGSTIPVDVIELPNDITTIGAGDDQTCALLSTGGIKCWGNNYYGQLGDGTYIDRSVPVDVVGLLDGATAIDGGYGHTCTLLSTGGIKCWGNNYNGQLGDGTFGYSTVPVSVFNKIFADVLYTNWAWQYIERLYSAGITGGCTTSPLNYCPDNSVTRAQMAVSLEKGVHYPSPFTAPNVVPNFSDTIGHWAEDWIEVLKSDGLTAGCGDGNYCPDYSVTRAQMAVFLLKGKYGSSYTPPDVGSDTGFGDVPNEHWAAAWIKQLAAEGITSGCSDGSYCPDAPVTRAQMAVFLVKTFNLP